MLRLGEKKPSSDSTGMLVSFRGSGWGPSREELFARFEWATLCGLRLSVAPVVGASDGALVVGEDDDHVRLAGARCVGAREHEASEQEEGEANFHPPSVYREAADDDSESNSPEPMLAAGELPCAGSSSYRSAIRKKRHQPAGFHLGGGIDHPEQQ